MVHRGCIVVEPCRHSALIAGGRRPSDTSATASTLNHKLALYVDEEFIDEHVVDSARHRTTANTLSPLAEPPSTEKRSRSADTDSRHHFGFLRRLI